MKTIHKDLDSALSRRHNATEKAVKSMSVVIKTQLICLCLFTLPVVYWIIHIWWSNQHLYNQILNN